MVDSATRERCNSVTNPLPSVRNCRRRR